MARTADKFAAGAPVEQGQEVVPGLERDLPCPPDALRNQAGGEGGRVGVGSCPGTFGELLQGALPWQEREFLVTLPISRYSIATFMAVSRSREIYVYPSRKEKSRRLAEKLMRVFGLDSGGFLSIHSELPMGKGCASSSADLVATALAIQNAFGVSISRASLARVMSSIEPSDGVMYPGITSFYHREGMLRKSLGYLPPLTIVGLDEGGQVDTVEFNARPRPFSRSRRAEYEGLLLGMERAVTHKDLRSLGEISTHSAILNQEVLPKAHLDLLLDTGRRHGALGVVAAHSGTHLGLLYPDAPDRLEILPAVVSELSRYCPNVRVYRTHDFRAAGQRLMTAHYGGDQGGLDGGGDTRNVGRTGNTTAPVEK